MNTDQKTKRRGRFQLFPILHHDIWEIRERGINSFNWSVKAVEFDADVQHWQRLSPQERSVVKRTHAFFIAGDGLIGEPMMEILELLDKDDLDLVELKLTIMSMMASEGLHFEAYSTVLVKLVSDQQEREELFRGYENSESVKAKIDWFKRWKGESLARKMLLQICFEGIFFQASFCIIFWFKNRGLLPGITQLNDYISKDEALHCILWITAYFKLNNGVELEEMKEILKSAAEVEFAYIDDVMQEGGIVGLTKDAVKIYVKFVVNYWAKQLQLGEIFEKVRNPFPFMEIIGLPGKSNFFERRSTEYWTVEVVAPPLTLEDLNRAPDDF